MQRKNEKLISSINQLIMLFRNIISNLVTIINKRVQWSSLVILAGVIATILVPVTEQASADSGKNITSHYSSGPSFIGNYSCPERQDAVATYPMQGTITYGEDNSDNLKGTGNFASCVYVMADNTKQFVNDEVFTGTIKGCGTGSMKLRITGSITAPDPVTGNQINHGNWTIVPNSGTSGLKNVTGSGVEDSIVDPAYNVTGLFTGTINCYCK